MELSTIVITKNTFSRVDTSTAVSPPKPWQHLSPTNNPIQETPKRRKKRRPKPWLWRTRKSPRRPKTWKTFFGIWSTGGESSTDVVGELFPGCGSFQDVEKIVVSSFTMIQPECAIEASPIHHRLLDYTSCKQYCTWPFGWRVDVGMTTSTTFLYWQRFIDTFTMTSQWYSWYSW